MGVEFLKPGSRITPNATESLRDITGSNLSKALHYFFTYALVFPKTMKCILICEMAGWLPITIILCFLLSNKMIAPTRQRHLKQCCSLLN